MSRNQALAVGAAAVLVVAVVAALALRPGSSTTIGPASPSPTVSVSPTSTSAAASPTASPPSPSPAPTAAATGDPTLASFITTHTRGWSPTGSTLLVMEFPWTGTRTRETTYLAVPVGGGSPTRLLTVRDRSSVAIRADGSQIALSITTAEQPPTSRLAVWDASSGNARWVTPVEPGAGAANPRWSPDGQFIYFGRFRVATAGASSAEDLGIWRIRPDGRDLQRVVEGRPAGENPPYVSIPHRVTAEGFLLWGRAYEGSSLELLELATGARRSYGFGHLDEWRGTRPRALVEGCSNTGCRGLLLWDDIANTRRTVLAEDQTTQGADWEPRDTGARIVVARLVGQQWRLQVIDEATLAATDVPGSENASWPEWTRAGIAFTYGQPGSRGVEPPTEVRLVTGGSVRTLYTVGAADLALNIVDVIER